MTKKSKTVGKTTELGMKGAKDIMSIVNTHICNINKKNKYSIELYTQEEILAYINKNEKLRQLAVQLGQVHNELVDHALDAWHISLQEKHPSEKAPKKESNLEQQSKAMRETSKKAIAQTRAKINKELYKQLKEEKEAAKKAVSNSTKKGGNQ